MHMFFFSAAREYDGLFTRVFVRCFCSRHPGDDDEHVADDASSDVVNDVSAGRLMTCTGIVELPTYVPRGVSVCVCLTLERLHELCACR